MPGFLAEVLARPENSYYVLVIKTALTWGDEPMDLLIPSSTRESLGSKLDLAAVELSNNKLKMAWQILKDETCQECGNPIWICHNSDRYIGFNVEYTTCFATQEIESYKEANNIEHKAGRNFYATPFMYGDRQLPSREEYLKKMAVSDDES